MTGEDSIERPGDQQVASLSLGAQHRASWPEECHGRGQITGQDAWHQGSGELRAGAALKEASGQRRGEVAPWRCDPTKFLSDKAQLHEGGALAAELRCHVDTGQPHLAQLAQGLVALDDLDIEVGTRSSGQLLDGKASDGLLQLDVVFADADGHGRSSI